MTTIRFEKIAKLKISEYKKYLLFNRLEQVLKYEKTVNTPAKKKKASILRYRLSCCYENAKEKDWKMFRINIENFDNAYRRKARMQPPKPEFDKEYKNVYPWSK